VTLYPWAEAGIAASVVSGLVLASIAVFSPHHATATSLRKVMLQRDWILYGIGALAVAFGALVFLQGDQIIAQRHFPGEQLGRYAGAGLLGRMIVWVGLPILTVYFTHRSGHQAGLASPAGLIGVYLSMIVIGGVAVLLLRDPLLRLFLGIHDEELSHLAARFATVMIPIGVLQAMGCHFLASRRLPECLAFAACAAGYLVALSVCGQTPERMLTMMAIGSSASVILLCLVWALRIGRNRNAAPNPGDLA
jgi:O-antigen/teichoic acid export membrane protein